MTTKILNIGANMRAIKMGNANGIPQLTTTKSKTLANVRVGGYVSLFQHLSQSNILTGGLNE